MQSKLLAKYKVIIWDFDGVILDSMAIRNTGFQDIFHQYPKEQIDQLLEYHLANGGLSRYVKIRHFFKVVRKETITDDIVLKFANDFKRIMLKKLINPSLLIMDTLDYLKESYQNYTYHIASGSDEVELNEICKGLGLATFFKDINGSPKAKNDIVKEIITKNNYNLSDCALIGDSINDYEAAKVNGISFFGYNNLALRNLPNSNYIETFNLENSLGAL